jgi:hypothetical protein
MLRTPALLSLLALCACASMNPAPAPSAAAAAQARALAAEKVKVREAASREAALESRAAHLQLELWERDAEIEDLEERLEGARRDVVRAMAKLRTLATRAEAASAMAETDVALQSLSRTGRDAQEIRQARELMQQGAAEFGQQNYGGALYLANQAKALLARAPRLGGADRNGQRPGEIIFAVPLRLRATGAEEVREGPGAGFRVAYVVKPGEELTGRSYLGSWVHVSDGSGREGWVPDSRVERRAAPPR